MFGLREKRRSNAFPSLLVVVFAAPLMVVGATGDAFAGRVAEKIVAVVNSDIILQSELEDQVKMASVELARESDAKAREKKLASLRRQVLERMIDEQLLIEQATELKVSVSSEDVDRAIDQIKKDNGVSQDQLVEALKEQGMTLSNYRQVMRKSLLRFKVVNNAVRSRVAVSEDDVKTYYEQNVRSSGAERKVRASHIFIQIPEGATDKIVAEKQAQAGQLVQRARAGEDFGKLAREFSEDPATRHEGGELGWFGKGALPPAIEELVFSMEKGEVRGPARAERGFHVIKLLDRKEVEARSFGEVKEQLRGSLYQQELEKQTRQWLQELRKKAHVELRL